MPATKFAVLLNQVSVPVMAELQADRVALRSSLLQLLRVVAFVVLPACIGLMLVAEDFVLAILTAKWAPVVPLVRLLAVCAGIQSLEMIFRTVLVARYRTNFLFYYTLAVLSVMPLTFWIGAVLLGSIGVAASWALVYPILMTGMTREVFKEVEISWRMVWEQTRLAIIATTVMAAVLVVLQWGLTGIDTAGSLARLVLAACSGALAYGLVIYLLGDRIVAELGEVLGWVFRPSKTAALEK
jgi:O-antigen/teichoic acid export membrane protein